MSNHVQEGRERKEQEGKGEGKGRKEVGKPARETTLLKHEGIKKGRAPYYPVHSHTNQLSLFLPSPSSLSPLLSVYPSPLHRLPILILFVCLATQRITAADSLDHAWFQDFPPPTEPELFPHFPARAEGHRRRRDSPSAPMGGQMNEEERELYMLMKESKPSGFNLKFG